MKIFRILLIGSLLCASSTASMAESMFASVRLCTDADLTGNYSMAEFKETPKGEEAAWSQDFHYQYLIFNSGPHTYNFVASRHRMQTMEDIKKAIVLSLGDGMHTPQKKYTLDESGLLNFYIEDRLDYSYRCMVALKASGNAKAGDLVFTGYSKRRTELYKVFRHWPEK